MNNFYEVKKWLKEKQIKNFWKKLFNYKFIILFVKKYLEKIKSNNTSYILNTFIYGGDNIKKLISFKKENGEITPSMTLEEFKNKKYEEYGITEKDIANMFFKAKKCLVESIYPVKLNKGSFSGEH
jgi:hypothetical protein